MSITPRGDTFYAVSPMTMPTPQQPPRFSIQYMYIGPPSSRDWSTTVETWGKHRNLRNLRTELSYHSSCRALSPRALFRICVRVDVIRQNRPMDSVPDDAISPTRRLRTNTSMSNCGIAYTTERREKKSETSPSFLPLFLNPFLPLSFAFPSLSAVNLEFSGQAYRHSSSTLNLNKT